MFDIWQKSAVQIQLWPQSISTPFLESLKLCMINNFMVVAAIAALWLTLGMTWGLLQYVKPLPSVTCISDVPWSKDLPSGFNLKHQHLYKLLESRTLQLVLSFKDPFHSNLFLVLDNDDTRNQLFWLILEFFLDARINDWFWFKVLFCLFLTIHSLPGTAQQ